MCDLCTALKLNQRGDAATPTTLKRNGDGTYTLTLTERQMTNLVLRLAASVLAERVAR